MRTFLFCFDANDISVSVNDVHIFVTTSKFIKSWYLAFNGTYVLKTDVTGRTMTEVFSPLLGEDVAYFMSEIEDTTSTGGRLLPEVWQWFNNKTSTLLASPTQ